MALTEIPNPHIPARVLEVRTGSDADYVDQPGKPGGDSVLIAIRDVDLPDSRVATTRVDRLELIAALGGVPAPDPALRERIASISKIRHESGDAAAWLVVGDLLNTILKGA